MSKEAIEKITSSIILSHDPVRGFVISPKDTARHILDTLKSLGYVKLAEDQSPPKSNDGRRKFGQPNDGYKEGMDDMKLLMLDAGFRKVKK